MRCRSAKLGPGVLLTGVEKRRNYGITSAVGCLVIPDNQSQLSM